MALHRFHKTLEPAIETVDPRKAGNSAVLQEAKLMNTRKLILATVAALTLSAYSVAGMAGNGNWFAYGRWQPPAPLEGTWVVTIQPIVCTTGDDVPDAPSVRAYLTFARGGTMTETNSNVAFEPGQRGPGHGYWERTGRTSYQFAFEAFIQFDSKLAPFRYKRGYQRLDQTVEMHTTDDWTSSGRVQFFAGTSTTDPSPSGCARSTGARMF
jgi:hypothetical protein